MKFHIMNSDRVVHINTFTPYGELTNIGVEYKVLAGLGLPNYCTLVTPPAEVEGKRRYFLDNTWKHVENWHGRTFYFADTTTGVIEDVDFDKPAEATWNEPPTDIAEGEVALLQADGTWTVVNSKIGLVAYLKTDPSVNYVVESEEVIPDTYTLKTPSEFAVWSEEDDFWHISTELKAAHFSKVEREWRDTKLSKVVARMDQYLRCASLAVENRRTPLDEDTFVIVQEDYALLCDYPNIEGFPLNCVRPTLEGDEFYT